MAKHTATTGIITIDVLQDPKSTTVNSFSVGAASGTLGSVIHGPRIEVKFLNDDSPGVSISMGAADALQLAEEIRAAVHRREDVRRA